MPKQKLIKLKSNLRIQPLFSGFSMQIDHLHPVFSSPRLFIKDLSYISSNIEAFDSWYLKQSNNFKTSFKEHKAFNECWNIFLDNLATQKGFCLDLQYKNIPTKLNGAIELFYTGLNKPSYKLNSLVYKNNSIKNLQSIILTDAEAIPNWHYWWGDIPSRFEIKRPLDHLSCTSLIDLILTPSDFNLAHEKLSMDMDREVLELLTEDYNAKPISKSVVSNMEIELLYVNHATVIFKRGDVSIVVDPLLNFFDKKNASNFYDYVPKKIDYVLITHAHYDHIDLPTLLTLRNRIGKILLPKASEIDCDFSIRKILEPYFPGRLIEIDSFDQLSLRSDLKITSLPFQGEHSDLISSKATWLISVSGKNLWFGADCRSIDINLFKFIREKYGEIDLMFVGTVSEGSPLSRSYPHLSQPLNEENDNSRTTRGAGHREIYELITALNPKSVYIYALGYEDWFKYFMGEPIHKYRDEFIQLKKMLDGKNKKLKKLRFVVGPQLIKV
jgi:L-ascorbate metabolism protein UlaG (beta-lactamase superfamily)